VGSHGKSSILFSLERQMQKSRTLFLFMPSTVEVGGDEN